MVSLVNFKLMPEDNQKNHDYELALSSSLSNMQATPLNPAPITKQSSHLEAVKTSPATNNNKCFNRSSDNNSNEFITSNNNNNNNNSNNNDRQRYHHSNKPCITQNSVNNILGNSNTKPPTPPKPHKLAPAIDVPSSPNSIMLPTDCTMDAPQVAKSHARIYQDDKGSIDNGYLQQDQQHHHVSIMSTSKNILNHNDTDNHHQNDLVPHNKPQQQQQQKLQQSERISNDDEFMTNIAKASEGIVQHPVNNRHQRQASICGNIHQAYCVKVASPNSSSSVTVNEVNSNTINIADSKYVSENGHCQSNKIHHYVNERQQVSTISVNNHQHQDDVNNQSYSVDPLQANYHRLESTQALNNVHQQQLQQQQQLTTVQSMSQHANDGQTYKQILTSKNVLRNNVDLSSEMDMKELSARVKAEANNCLENHKYTVGKPDKSKYLLNPESNDRLGRFFTVTWRDLSFVIQPKWHHSSSSNKKSDSIQNSCANNTTSSNLPSDACGNPVGAANSDTNNITATSPGSILKSSLLIKNLKQTKVVLDSLDGCFKSGELTAILGPSGAGKTTLLDCLTGHRKQGLSGSIKIRSSSTQSPCIGNNELCCYNNGRFIPLDQKHPQDQQKLPIDCQVTGLNHNAKQRNTNNNLKVSIIPQNDHLIGHLTVYETLSYASKMKNCFDRKFDHKSNIERVSQQLGLLSCLSTRINKLSGGQYKRVSIAQELLSNPDILILDEPTSGLDAMTCYQTVQVLRRLADNRQLTNNQIAIILTIHQPNSDVFQQFNHVYVVAQGGKSIYEGSPSGIVSVIQKVGLNMPNINYNPATMIVEIAAGKFGYDSIEKLNKIQKKQYSRSNYNHHSSDYCSDCSDSEQTTNYSSGDESETNGDDVDEKKKNRSKRRITLSADNIDDDGTKFNQDNNNNIESNDIDGMNTGLTNGIVNKAFQGDYDKVDHNVLSNVVIVNPSQLMVSQHKGVGGQNIHRRKGRGGGPANGDDKPHNNNNNNHKKNCGRSSKSSDNSKRLKLNSLKADQKFPFWRHTYLHFHRSWLSIVRDPMLCGMQLFLHIIIPIMVSMVYGPNVGQPNACPRAGPMDLITFALEPEDSTLNLQEELRTTLENIGYIFFKLYGIIFAAMTVTVLTFPLDMHVLVKEFRNGWYGLSSYFLGRTLADIPFQLTLPFLAMSLSYYATGQPYSYLQWRFMSITAILILSSLIAQSQGLLFGAILMDKMKAAVFVAPAATTPIILFAGFLVRTQSIPYYLRPLSNLSYLRYAIEACLISRYGFNQCECDPAIFNQTVPELPPIARTMLDYWLSSFKAEQQLNNNNNNLSLLATSNSTDLTYDNNNATSLSLFSNNSTSLLSNNTVGNNVAIAYSNMTTTTTTSSPIHLTDDYVGGAATVSTTNQPDLFTKLIDSLAKANSFGRNITSCDQVVPYPMIDYNLKDSQLFDCFAVLLFMLIFTRFLTFFIVSYKVKRKV